MLSRFSYCEGRRYNKKEMSKQYGVLFLPWAPFDWKALGGKLRVGAVELQPFSAFQVEPKVRRFLERYFNRYRDLYDKPVDTITLCHYRPEERGYLHPVNETELQEVKDAMNLLLFCAVWDYLREAIGGGWTLQPPPNAETLELMGQFFTDATLEDENPMIGLFFHGLRQIEELDEIHFSIPPNAHMRSPIRLNLPLLEQLQKVFQDDFDADERRRILRSLEWFRLAHRKDQAQEVLVVCMATALETLFPPPINPKTGERQLNKTKETLADTVDKWLRSRWIGVVEQQHPDNKGKIVSRTAAGFWMWDFYDLRGRIVHGDAISEEDLVMTLPPVLRDARPVRIYKTEIASFLYGALLIHEKLAAEYLPEESEETQNESEEVREILKYLYRDLPWKMDECLKRLGWIEPPKLDYSPRHASAVREYLAETLGDALQELSSKSIVEARERMRPKPFKEEPSKG